MLRGWTRGNSTRVATAGAGAAGNAISGAGAAAGVGVAGAHASNKHGPTTRPAAMRTSERLHVMRSIPRAIPEGSRDLTESRRPVSRVLSVLTCPRAPARVHTNTGRSFLSACSHPHAPAAYPRLDVLQRPCETGHLSPLIWPCSDWGLPSHLRYRRRGGLLPHPFTLTAPTGSRDGFPAEWRFAFCCTVRRTKLTPHAPRRYLAVYPVEPGLSSVPELAPKHRDHPADDRSMSARNITGPPRRPEPELYSAADEYLPLPHGDGTMTTYA